MKYHMPDAVIISHEQTGESIFLLSIEAPNIAKEASPGQFVHVRTSKGYDPLLRRPLSVCQVDRRRGLILLWYMAVGKGTRLLSGLKTGDNLDVLGPLGKGFDTDLAGKRVFLVGGGMGLAPLLFLAAEMMANNEVIAFFGAKSKGYFPPQKLMPSLHCEFSTEDGSKGYCGLVTDLLKRRLEQEKPDRVYACGPSGLLREVVLVTKRYNLPLQVSLEALMSCGVGACLGCACESSQDGNAGWLKVCRDGPVFWAQEVGNL